MRRVIRKLKHYGNVKTTVYKYELITRERKIFDRIRDHAGYSMYRMNAKTSDIYTFSIDDDGKDWEGGWDWSKGVVDPLDYFLDLEDGNIYKKI